MSGVTHFERRDRHKFVHAECLFCGTKIKGTPRQLSGAKGEDWQRGWLEHIRDHILEHGTTLQNLNDALNTAMSVAREHDRNK